MTEPFRDKSPTPWQGNWKERLQEKLILMGHGNLEEFLEANPGVGYVNLARLLGDANVAAIQLYSEHIRRGIQANNIRCVAMDCLVRFLNEYLPRGWKNGRHFQHRSASAFASWSTSIAAIVNSDKNIDRKLKSVFDILESLPIPVGWLPVNIGDVFIAQAFAEGWPNIE